jgi:hypothetical protein
VGWRSESLGMSGRAAVTGRDGSRRLHCGQDRTRAGISPRRCGHAGRPGFGAAGSGAARRAGDVRQVLTARCPRSHQTLYAAVGCHHGPQLIQPTR